MYECIHFTSGVILSDITNHCPTFLCVNLNRTNVIEKVKLLLDNGQTCVSIIYWISRRWLIGVVYLQYLVFTTNLLPLQR